MDYFTAKQIYRDATRDDYREPAQAKSRRVGKLWKLRDRHGAPIAIVSEDGQILAKNSFLTSPATREI